MGARRALISGLWRDEVKVDPDPKMPEELNRFADNW
jgi:hypothetical protein